MRKYRVITTLLAITITQCSFAADDMSSKECDTIANACITGGFTDAKTPDKSFWQDCMHPILLNKTVTGIEVDAKDVVACRKAKIAKMKIELKELEKVAKKQS